MLNIDRRSPLCFSCTIYKDPSTFSEGGTGVAVEGPSAF